MTEDFDDVPSDDQLDASFRLSRDLRAAAATLTDREARYLVDTYYKFQKDRIRTAHQERTSSKAGEPHAVLAWLAGRSAALEDSIRGALLVYAKRRPIGQWCLSVHAIGPVVTAGLLANIDITKAPTVGHIWRFAGLDPTQKWLSREKAETIVHAVAPKGAKITPEVVLEVARLAPIKEATFMRFAHDTETGKPTRESLVATLSRRPWNASLKRLAWIIGGLFVRLRASKNDVYGKHYDARKARELEMNEAGAYAELATRTLQERRFSHKETRETYEAGRLPLGRSELRARRWATKLFLAHYHEAAYFAHYGKLPPAPFSIAHLGHAHYIEPPNIDVIPGWRDARSRSR